MFKNAVLNFAFKVDVQNFNWLNSMFRLVLYEVSEYSQVLATIKTAVVLKSMASLFEKQTNKQKRFIKKQELPDFHWI